MGRQFATKAINGLSCGRVGPPVARSDKVRLCQELVRLVPKADEFQLQVPALNLWGLRPQQGYPIACYVGPKKECL
jgi:hypothetical protein